MTEPADSKADVTGYSPDEIRRMWTDFRANACRHCGGSHARACPRVRRLEFHTSGTLASAEFWRDGQWPMDSILWPEDLPPSPDEE